MQDYCIRIVREEEKEIELELFNRVFNNHYDINFWNLKHYQNPNGNSIFFGAYDGDKLIAINGFMPMRYIGENVEYKALESCESAVDPQYRHRGIFSKLITAAEEWAEHNDIDFLWGMPNMFSAPGFEKLGWKIEKQAMSYGVINSYSKWLKADRHFRPIADAYLIGSFLKKSLVMHDKNYSIKKIDADEFVELHKYNSGVECSYSEGFVDWKRQLGAEFYAIEHNEQTAMIVVKNYNIISFYEALINDKKTVIGALNYFITGVESPNGEYIIYIDQTSDFSLIAKSAGFVTKREPPFVRIVKRISEKSFKINQAGFWFNELERD